MNGERPGFGRVEQALKAGAGCVDDLLHAAWKEHGKAVVVDAERYEPDDWERLTREVKDAARLYGADLVGVTTLNREWLYGAGLREDGPFDADRHTTVMVIAVPMDYRGILESPTLRAAAATNAGYSMMTVVSMSVAVFLRSLGFDAIPAGNDIALSVPLAQAAGLGEVGRTGQLITQPFGPRVRLCKVFTDAPLVCDSPIAFGAAELCQTCTACVDGCEGNAIPEGLPDADAGRWLIDAQRCREFWRVNGTSCANCLARCPFNVPPER